MSQQETPQRLYLLTVPRCGSNLLQRMLSEQPGLEHSNYHLFKAWVGSNLEDKYNAKRQLDSLSGEERKALDERFQAAYESMLDALEAAKAAGKRAFIKEHVIMLLDPLNVFRLRYPEDKGPPVTVRDPNSTGSGDGKRTSATLIPDEILLSFQPIFQIRHPALSFPSAVRAVRDISEPGKGIDGMFEDILQTYQWSRKLFEWYAANGVSPLVIDADDVMDEEGAAVKRLCKATGLDADKVLLKWGTREDGTPVEKRFLSTINGSTGILRGYSAADISLADEEEKWKADFEPDLAASLSRRVRASMDDYEWLKARRL